MPGQKEGEPPKLNATFHGPAIISGDGKIAYGLRIYDIKNPRLPKEVGWFIPPTPTKRYGPLPYDKLVSQTEDVLVDRPSTFMLPTRTGGFSFFATTKATAK
jgi:hypothetical protein